MAWLESHGNLARHPKTRRLMQRMGWTLPHTIGNLHLLWYWALDFAPTGDLTKFAPEQLTCDLDLGDASPEQFIQAMVEVGFIDRTEEGGRRLHDWPHYTAKSLRPKFRRQPERWHQVLTAYNRPIPPRRQRRASYSQPGRQSPPARAGTDLHLVVPTGRDASEQPASSYDSPDDQAAGQGSNAIRVSHSDSDVVRTDPNIFHTAPGTQRKQQTPPAPAPESRADIPHRLAALPGFTTIWWPKFLELYKAQGCPLTAYEQSEVLARLAQKPLQAVAMLKTAVDTPGNCSSRLPVARRGAEHFANTS